jgi:phosphonate transport system permease protein
MVLILFPGLWPGAVALGIYTLGVLGRLFAEAFEDRDPGPSTAVGLFGAGAVASFFYGTLPTAQTRLVSLSLYRWEVIARETVVVGVVGAGGIGQLMNDHLAARDFAAVTGVVIGLLVVTGAIDGASSGLRGMLRGR